MKRTMALAAAILMCIMLFAGCSNIEGNEPTQKIADYDKEIISETFDEADAQVVKSVCDYLYSIRENKIPDIDKIFKSTNALELKDMSSVNKIYVLVYENDINLIITDDSTTVTFVKGDKTMVTDIGFCLIEKPEASTTADTL